MIDHSATLAAVPFRLEGFKPTARFVNCLVSLNQLRFGSLPSRALHLASARTHEIPPTAWTTNGT